MVTIEELDKQILETRKDLKILELEREVLKLKSMFPTTVVSTGRAWNP